MITKEQLYYIVRVIGTGAIFGIFLRLLTHPNTGWPSIAIIGACLGLAFLIIFIMAELIVEEIRRWRSLRKGPEALGGILKALFLPPVGIVAMFIAGTPFWLGGLLAAIDIYLFDIITQAAIPARLGWIASGTVYGAVLALILAGLIKLLSRLGYRTFWRV